MHAKGSRLLIGHTLLLLCLAPAITRAQAIRYELGQRLRACEAAWEQTPDVAARNRATAHLKQAVTLFFSFRLNDAARRLDQARFALASATEPTPAAQWAASLYLNPETRFVDISQKTLNLTLTQLYPGGADMPADAVLRIRMPQVHSVWASGYVPSRATEEIRVSAIPQQISLNLAKFVLNKPRAFDRDYELQLDIVVNGKTLAQSTQTISLAARPAERLATLKQQLAALTDKGTTVETMRMAAALLDSLWQKQTLETNYPAAMLLRQAEDALNHHKAGMPYYQTSLDVALSGMRGNWLSMALPDGTMTARVFKPTRPGQARPNDPVPLVIALHGAGGTENMFFDAYGVGKVARLCEERGWLLVSPRGTGMKPERIPQMIAELAKLTPIDRRRVFVVGHSMGGGQTAALAGLMSEGLAGVAVLGGGGTVPATPADNFKALPYYVGIGTEDFALPRARELRAALEKAGAAKLTYREYPGIEHLMIVQVALPDVFAFFDGISKTRAAAKR
ncbi:MAG: alpha/beta fold hydrolase [Blastocatellia bacterium]